MEGYNQQNGLNGILAKQTKIFLTVCIWKEHIPAPISFWGIMMRDFRD